MKTPDDETSASRTVLDKARVDDVNLEQALLDFELANARVLDLTRRLTTLSSELMTARQELEEGRLGLSRANAELEALRQENALIKASLAYRGLRFIGDARARLLR